MSNINTLEEDKFANLEKFLDTMGCINIIIDDLTNKNRFYYFRNNKYIMFHKKYKLLSDIMKIYT